MEGSDGICGSAADAHKFFCGGRSDCVASTEKDTIAGEGSPLLSCSSSEPGWCPMACGRKGIAFLWASSSLRQTDQSTLVSFRVPSWPSPFQPQCVTGEEGKMVPPLFKKRSRSLSLTELQETRMSRLAIWVARTVFYQQMKTCDK